MPKKSLFNFKNNFAYENLTTRTERIRYLPIGGDLEEFEISEELNSLPRTNQISDFHCVATWSKLNLNWSGHRFNDFYKDGYKTSLPLKDLMQQNVLLADQLDNKPLTLEHGAPIRIVAPDHYGYKNLKHIKRIEFYTEKQIVKQGFLSFMDQTAEYRAQQTINTNDEFT